MYIHLTSLLLYFEYQDSNSFFDHILNTIKCMFRQIKRLIGNSNFSFSFEKTNLIYDFTIVMKLEQNEINPFIALKLAVSFIHYIWMIPEGRI